MQPSLRRLGRRLKPVTLPARRPELGPLHKKLEGLDSKPFELGRVIFYHTDVDTFMRALSLPATARMRRRAMRNGANGSSI